MSCASFRLIAPILSLTSFAFLLFALDAAVKENSAKVRRWGFWLTIAAVVVSALLMPLPGQAGMIFGRQMLIWDGLSYFLSGIAILTVLFVLLIGENYSEYKNVRMSAYLGLLLMSAAGLSLLAASNDFLMVFIAIELIGIPSFILTGYLRNRERSSEAAIKFFLIGAFSTAMLAYGISIIYGLTGATSLTTLRDSAAILQDKAALAMLAFFFILVSFGFKIALVPFHMWVPDAFEGAPTPIAAYLSVGPKIAGVAIALRVFGLSVGHTNPAIFTVIAALAALTMTVANVIGLQQTNVIRLFAYSSIAHMGYILLGLIASGPQGMSSIYLYGAAYLFMNLGAFAILIIVSNAMGSTQLSAFSGLSKRAPGVSALLVLFMISLAGLPPTAGFVAKFYVFTAVFQGQWVWLVLLAAANSVISVGYYFKILHAMYFKASQETQPLEIGAPIRLTLCITSFCTLLLGVGPQFFFNLSDRFLGAGKDSSNPTVSVSTTEMPVTATIPEATER